MQITTFKKNGSTVFVAQVDTMWTAIWHGGEYIEWGLSIDFDMEAAMDGDSPWKSYDGVDLFNVWDHAEGKPRIRRTKDSYAEYLRGKFDDVWDNITGAIDGTGEEE